MSLLATQRVGPCLGARGDEITPRMLTEWEDTLAIQLAELRANKASFAWVPFKPGVQKLILSGTDDARHVAILWYQGQSGAVAAHYHDKTESVFVIEGAQSDAQGVYPRGTFSFNPPGSGHRVFESAGLFLLAYAAPADFARTHEIGPYRNVVIEADYGRLPLGSGGQGSCFAVPLAPHGGMRARFLRPRPQQALHANVVMVLRGSCEIAGRRLASDTLLVHRSATPRAYAVSASDGDCLLYEMSFD